MIANVLPPSSPHPSHPGAKAKAGQAGQADQAPDADSVSLGGETPLQMINKMIIERVLTHVESATHTAPGAGDAGAKVVANESAPTAEAGSAAEAATAPSAGELDQSPAAVSQRIFDGITGFIFGAFSQSHPDMTSEDFAEFKGQVLKGVEQGVSEAREILGALSALNDDVDNTIDETIDLLYAKLDDFFAGIEEQLAESEAAA